MESGRTRHGLVWTGVDAPRMEYVDVIVQGGGLVATGCQIAVEPEPYSVRYELRLNRAGVAERFSASSRGTTAERELTMDRDPGGSWTYGHGTPRVGPGSRPQMDNPGPMPRALDIDLGYSPLFDSTPVLRDGLLAEGAPARDYLMALVSVPDLTVTASHQRYEPLGRQGDLIVVRYTSLDSGFTAKIAFDADGFVVEYEGFLKRIAVDRYPAAGVDA